MAGHVSSSFLKTTSRVSDESEENTAPDRTKKMKTVPKIAQTMYSTMKTAGNSIESDSNSTTGPNLVTRSPIRSAKRKGLATLQPSATGKGSVVGGQRRDTAPTDLLKQKSITSTFSWTIKQDSSPSLSGKHSWKSPPPFTPSCTTSTQTDFDDWLGIGETRQKDDLAEEALALMRAEPSQEECIKEIAEERRIALEETLKENEELYEEIDCLKDKCETLEKSLSEAENYKLLYLSLLEENKQCCQCDPRDMAKK
eukprot:gene18251-20071_t